MFNFHVYFFLRTMANKASKGRQKRVITKGLVSTGGPKKTFKREILKSAKLTCTARSTKISGEVPLTVCVVPFHQAVFNSDLVSFLSHLVANETVIDSPSGVSIRTGTVANQPKKRIQLVVPFHRESIDVILDAAKAADALLCLFPSEATYEQSCFDELGYKTLTALRMQGLPPLVMGSMIDSSEKKIGMKTVQRYFFSEFSADKAKFVMPSANVKAGDVESIARQVVNTVVSAFSGSLSSTVSESLALRRMRGYMLIEKLQVSDSGDVVISGHARGAGFGTQTAVHLTGYPHTFRVKKLEVMEENDGMEEVKIVESSGDQDLCPLRPAEMQEQTWPTEEEEAEAERQQMLNRRMKRVAVPAGATSEVEAAWFGEDVVGEDSMEQEFLEEEEDEKIIEGMFDWDKVQEEAEFEASSAKKPIFEERSREEMDFVDEVDTPQTMTARERFQKYRGLKSLRNANWDAYEELPVEYSQIHEFQDIPFITKQSFGGISESGKICLNKLCRITLEPVVAEDGQVAPVTGSRVPLVASTMAPYESKVTLVHCRLSRLPESLDLAIKSKDLVTVQIGFRRFEVRPLFSEIPKYSASTGTSPIQRMYRQLPEDTNASILMSFYAPAMFGSSPALAFHSGRLALWGSVAGCAPNRPMIVKRATLTGYPFRVHQTKAVCRFMFFNPEDIDWFKPVELVTKKGLRGHIIESLGTHGYMKCRFNGQLTSDDVICLHLYKRVFPKFHTLAWGQQ